MLRYVLEIRNFHLPHVTETVHKLKEYLLDKIIPFQANIPFLYPLKT